MKIFYKLVNIIYFQLLIINNIEEKKIKIFNNKGKTEPIFSALVSNSEQEAACREAGIEKIYHKQYDVAKEKNLHKTDKIKIGTNLASNLYQVIMGEKNGIKGQSLDWNLNVFNNYTLDLFFELNFSSF